MPARASPADDGRPREALGGRTPPSAYGPSSRPYPARLPALDYPGHIFVKRVANTGTFRFEHRRLVTANALTRRHDIGLGEGGDGVWSIYLGPVLLARLDERDYPTRG